jgi:hypothetical protein
MGKIIRDYSKHDDLYIQRNNKKFPFSTCSRTSAIMALNQAGWDDEVTQLEFKDLAKGIQPEDVLTSLSYFRGPTDRLSKVAPWFFDKDGDLKVPAHQVPQNLVDIINFLFGTGVATLMIQPSYNTEMLKNKLDQGYGIAIFGNIKQPNGVTLNHVVSLAGYELTSDVITSFIIDDPYGAYKTNYELHHGNGVRVPYNEFAQFFYQEHLWMVLIAPRKDYK